MKSTIGQHDIYKTLEKWGKPIPPLLLANILKVGSVSLISELNDMVANDLAKWYGDNIGLVHYHTWWERMKKGFSDG